MSKTTVPIVKKIMSANDQIAKENQELLSKNKVLTVNVMASPGAGKTSLILRTIENISTQYKIAVIEGDTAPVTIDSDKISSLNIPVVQINTGGECHLDALMVRNGIEQLDLSNTDLLIIENVGNLVCPAAFRLGEHFSVVIASIPEGDDKPYKYPNIYRGIQSLILNKTDLLPYVDFNIDYFKKGIEALNPGAVFFSLSCKSGDGFDKWTNWLKTKIQEIK
ncbi:MAG: hydrogenase accessory protein HypB [Methanobacteriota archaeon]|nr:MAG: hydrogenase accessory protein HypB [Euryarchaeota archaeon]